MLLEIPGLGDDVVAYKAVGTVTSADYRDVLGPAIARATSGGRRAKLLYLLGPDFTRYDPGAMLADAGIGLTHATSFERIAVVTDHDWIRGAIHLFGGLIPGEVRWFSVEELGAAETWIKA